MKIPAATRSSSSCVRSRCSSSIRCSCWSAQKRKAAELKAHPPAAVAQIQPGAPAFNAPPAVTRAAALAASPRAPIATPALKGSISLRGARLDDLFLTHAHYRQDLPAGGDAAPRGHALSLVRGFRLGGPERAGSAGRDHHVEAARGPDAVPRPADHVIYTNGQGLTTPAPSGGRELHVHAHRHRGQRRDRPCDHCAYGSVRQGVLPTPASPASCTRGRWAIWMAAIGPSPTRISPSPSRPSGVQLHERLDRHHRRIPSSRP